MHGWSGFDGRQRVLQSGASVIAMLSGEVDEFVISGDFVVRQRS